MNSTAVLLSQVPFHRIADVRGDAGEVGETVGVAGHSLAVIDDFEEQLAVHSPTDNGDVARAGVERIFSQLADCLEGMCLRAGDDLDRVPLVADPQPAAGRRSRPGSF